MADPSLTPASPVPDDARPDDARRGDGHAAAAPPRVGSGGAAPPGGPDAALDIAGARPPEAAAARFGIPPVRRFERLARACAVIGGAIGLAGLLGWVLDVPVLKSGIPGAVAMKANTAVCFVLLSLSIGLLPRRAQRRRLRNTGRALGAAAALVGMLTLLQYALGIDLGLDQLLFREARDAVGTSHPGRMAPNTALGFVGLGLASALLFGRQFVRLGQALALLGFVLALVATLGHAYGVDALYGVGAFTRMALPTSIAFFALSAGALMARVDQGVMRIVAAPTPGGMLLRRVLPVTLLLPAMLGALALALMRTRHLSPESASALLVTTLVLVLAATVVAAAAVQHRVALARMAAEAALQAEHGFRSAIEQAVPAGIAAFDLEGRHIYANPAFCRLVGWEREALMNNADQPYWPEDAGRSLPDRLAGVLGGSDDERGFETRLVRRDGHVFDALVTPAPLAQRDRHSGWLLTVVDISERVQAERAVREGHALLHGVTEGTTDAVYVKDLQGRYLMANTSAARQLGRTPESMVGMTNAQMIPADAAQRLAAEDRLVVETGTAHTFEARVPSTLTGEVRTFSTLKAPYRDLEGRIKGVIGISRDITERKQTEEAAQLLADASRVLASTLDFETVLARVAETLVPGLADWAGVDIVDDAGAIQRITVVHRDPEKVALVRMLDDRYPPSPDAPTGAPHVIRSGEPELYAEIPEALLAEVAEDEEHLRILLELGMRSAMVVPMISRGRTIGAMTLVNAETPRSFGQDDLALALELAHRCALSVDNARLYRNVQQELTVRQETQRRLELQTMQLERSNRELERSNQELEQFAYIASHDLREPLRKIKNYTELLARRYEGRLDDRADKYIRYAADGAERMNRMIQDLLAYSRAGRTMPDPRPIDVDAVLDDTLEDLEHTLEAAGARVEREPLPAVLAHRSHVEQLLLNLITNAVKFARPGEPPRVHIRSERDGEMHRFAVTDNGIGMEPAEADRIFKLFQRLHTQHAYPGTGIGLAVCQKIVQRYGGHIWVDSEPGQGSTFYLTLPAAEAAT